MPLPYVVNSKGLTIKFSRIDSNEYNDNYKLPDLDYISGKNVIITDMDSIIDILLNQFPTINKSHDSIIILHNWSRNIFILENKLHFHYNGEAFYRESIQDIAGYVENRKIMLLLKDDNIEFYNLQDQFIFFEEYNPYLDFCLVVIRGEGYIDGYRLYFNKDAIYITDKITDARVNWVNNNTAYIKRFKYVGRKFTHDYIKLTIANKW